MYACVHVCMYACCTRRGETQRTAEHSARTRHMHDCCTAHAHALVLCAHACRFFLESSPRTEARVGRFLWGLFSRRTSRSLWSSRPLSSARRRRALGRRRQPLILISHLPISSTHRSRFLFHLLRLDSVLFSKWLDFVPFQGRRGNAAPVTGASIPMCGVVCRQTVSEHSLLSSRERMRKGIIWSRSSTEYQSNCVSSVCSRDENKCVSRRVQEICGTIRGSRFHDTDHACHVQQARRVRGDPSCRVSVHLATHEGIVTNLSRDGEYHVLPRVSWRYSSWDCCFLVNGGRECSAWALKVESARHR